MTSVSQRLFAPVAAVHVVSAVVHEAVTMIPVGFQPAPHAASVLA